MAIRILLCALLALLTGCLNLEAHLAPINPSVKPTLIGEDCTPIVFGIGIGTSTVETAMKNGGPPVQHYRISLNPIITPIKTIHSIALNDQYLFGFGGRCIVVAGEP
jgi:hypothetical protein